MSKCRLFVLLAGMCTALGLAAAPSAVALSASDNAKAIFAMGGYGSAKTSCWNSTSLCTEIANPQDFWGKWYVGHDEPSVLFYSRIPGSGYRMSYSLKLPRDPAGAYSNSKSYNFELHPAFWFGMAMCDTFSYPQTNPACKPDSDSNAVDVRTNPRHPGAGYMELQFYPPGWIPQFAATSCDPTKWCAALNIDSLSENPIAGTTLNPTCQSQILGGIEYINYAYLTRNGEPQGPPNPLQFSAAASGIPGPNVLYMNPGDNLVVSLADSPNGLVTRIVDKTTGQTGFMTASAANHFGHIVPAPTGTSCNVKYYDFHPMYSTSGPNTTVPWTAHTYNIAFADEIGHFDFCTHIDANSGSCNGLEGIPGDQEPADGDDNFCFPSDESLRYPASGCTDTNDPGFDGVPYHPLWPDGNTTVHPTPILFTSPLTVGGARYSQMAFEADLPRIEAADFGGSCDRTTGAGCTNPPPTDDGHPAAFYPYFSTTGTTGACRWGIGSTLPNTLNNFGGSSATEFGHLHASYYYVFNGGGATAAVIDNYQRVLPTNPC